MDSPDTKLYLCSHCFRRCLWNDLSVQEHRCPRCRLPSKGCAICDKEFEPRDKTQLYCKRCDFYLLKHAAVQPPPIQEEKETKDQEAETTRSNTASVLERWQEIKTAAGIVEDTYPSD